MFVFLDELVKCFQGDVTVQIQAHAGKQRADFFFGRVETDVVQKSSKCLHGERAVLTFGGKRLKNVVQSIGGAVWGVFFRFVDLYGGRIGGLLLFDFFGGVWGVFFRFVDLYGGRIGGLLLFGFFGCGSLRRRFVGCRVVIVVKFWTLVPLLFPPLWQSCFFFGFFGLFGHGFFVSSVSLVSFV